MGLATTARGKSKFLARSRGKACCERPGIIGVGSNVSPTDTAESTNREIQVEVPADEVTRTTESLVQKYQKLARLPGFRRGHVPASIIKQRFSEDIKSEVVETLVPRYFRQEAEKKGLVPVSQPRVTDLHIHDGEPLRFKASFEVMPEVKVEGYK